MSQTPVTITYTLEEVLAKLERRLDKIEEKIDNLQKDVTELKIGQARIEAELSGLSKRLDFQEFVNKGILVGLVVAK